MADAQEKNFKKMDLMQGTFARVTVFVLEVISKELGVTPSSSSSFSSMKEGTQKSKIVLTSDWGKKPFELV